jgi:hypothetical protein
VVKSGTEGEGLCTDVVVINRPDNLGDIADLGLTLAEAKLLLPDAWQRFERLVDAVAKAGPQHRPSKVSPQSGKRKPAGRAGSASRRKKPAPSLGTRGSASASG